MKGIVYYRKQRTVSETRVVRDVDGMLVTPGGVRFDPEEGVTVNDCQVPVLVIVSTDGDAYLRWVPPISPQVSSVAPGPGDGADDGFGRACDTPAFFVSREMWGVFRFLDGMRYWADNVDLLLEDQQRLMQENDEPFVADAYSDLRKSARVLFRLAVTRGGG